MEDEESGTSAAAGDGGSLLEMNLTDSDEEIDLLEMFPLSKRLSGNTQGRMELEKEEESDSDYDSADDSVPFSVLKKRNSGVSDDENEWDG